MKKKPHRVSKFTVIRYHWVKYEASNFSVDEKKSLLGPVYMEVG